MSDKPPTQEIERRVVPGDVRAKRLADGPSILAGYAAVFGQETVIGGGGWAFRELIEPGAFTDAIRSDDILGLWNHNPDVVLGRSGNGTVRVSEDRFGLPYEIDVNAADPEAVGVAARIERGDVHQSSFAFSLEDGGDEWDNSGVKAGQLPLRRIKRVARLYDVSPVAAAAYPQTSVSARAEARARELTALPVSEPASIPATEVVPEPPAEPLPAKSAGPNLEWVRHDQQWFRSRLERR